MASEKNSIWNRLTLGMCYYPEQWPSSLWQEDLQRMKRCGVSVIRIGEFAWSIFEPEENLYDYSIFDRFLDLAQEEDMQVLFCTPTAAPPAWLTEKYPEVLNVRMDGVPYRHGMRRHYTYNSPVYQDFCRNIVRRISEHFAWRPCIIGWQIDNEINCAMDEFYSESDTIAFRKFLQKKYGCLDALNGAWGNVFWSQAYHTWEEIHLPRVTVYGTTNPHLQLDYIRFISDSAIAFCAIQTDILRRYKKPEDFITTNGLFSNLDSHKLMSDYLDVFCYDSYPNFAYARAGRSGTDLRDRKWSRNLMQVRSVCPHFGITEQQAGACGWVNSVQNPAPKSPAPYPGQMMLWAMQSIMHGADFVEFFRWRTSVMGTEIYWHGILDWDNHDNRKVAELNCISQRMQALSGMAGASYYAGAALVQDYDNLWDAQIDVWHEDMADESEKAVFTCAQLTHTPLDTIFLTERTTLKSLETYQLLFYPHPLILKKENAALLLQYVKNGGILVLGARTGMKDKTGKCVMAPIPGLFARSTHTIVEDSTLSSADHPAPSMNWNGRILDTGSFHEALSVSDPVPSNETLSAEGILSGDETSNVRILAYYQGGYFDGKPALCETTIGKGKILHYGGTLTFEITEAFLDYAGVKDPFRDILSVPKECETALRIKDGRSYLFVLNYSGSSQLITLHKKMTDADNGKDVYGAIRLGGFETKVYSFPLSCGT